VKYRQFENAAVNELNQFINQIVINSRKTACFSSMRQSVLPPKPARLPDGVLQLNDWQRHMNVGFGCIARRPSQLHQT
jgi:hypothetical protein